MTRTPHLKQHKTHAASAALFAQRVNARTQLESTTTYHSAQTAFLLQVVTGGPTAAANRWWQLFHFSEALGSA